MKMYTPLLDTIKGPEEPSGRVPSACWLGDKLEAMFDDAVKTRRANCVTARIRAAWYAKQLKYTPEAAARIKTVQTYYGIFAKQRHAFISWANDLVKLARRKPWVLEPDEIPDVPQWMKDEAVGAVFQALMNGDPSLANPMGFAEAALRDRKKFATAKVVANAKRAAKGMEKTIVDQMDGARWKNAMVKLIDHMATYPNCFLLLGDLTLERRLEWRGSTVKVANRETLLARVIAPQFVFPMKDCTTTQDGQGVFVVDRMARNNLLDLINEDAESTGVLAENIEAAIERFDAHREHRDPDIRELDAQRGESTPGSLGMSNGMYDVVRFFGDLEVGAARDYRVKVDVQDKKTVSCEVWMLGGYVIRAVRINHPLGMRPLHSASYEKEDGLFWGTGLFDILESIETKANALDRRTFKHAAGLSEPVTFLDVERFGANEVPEQLEVGRTYRIGADYTRGGHGPLNVYSLPNNMQSLIMLRREYKSDAQQLTNIPDYMGGGTNVGAAGRTASVYSQLQANSTKGIVARVDHISEDIIEPAIRWLFGFNMMYNPDKTIKGAVTVVITGLQALIDQEAKDARIRDFMQFSAPFTQVMMPDGQPLIPMGALRKAMVSYLEGRDLEDEAGYAESPQFQTDVMAAATQPQGTDGRSVLAPNAGVPGQGFG